MELNMELNPMSDPFYFKTSYFYLFVYFSIILQIFVRSKDLDFYHRNFSHCPWNMKKKKCKDQQLEFKKIYSSDSVLLEINDTFLAVLYSRKLIFLIYLNTNDTNMPQWT